MLEIEAKLFEQKLPELIKSDVGKFVLIKDDQIIGTFEALGDALKKGYEMFKSKPFYVKQILFAQHPLDFSNNYLLV